MSHKIKKSYGTMFYVSDMKISIQWYKTKLGLSPSYESPDWTQFELPNSHSICLHAMEAGAAKKPENDGILIIEVEGLDSLLDSFRKSDVRIVSDKREVHPGAFSADISDAEGNPLSFYENTAAR